MGRIACIAGAVLAAAGVLGCREEVTAPPGPQLAWEHHLTEGRFTAVWGSASNDVFALDPNYWGLFHYDGSSWSPIESTAHGANAVWGTRQNDLFSVGNYGSPIRHYDGSTWTAVTEAIPHYLHALWGTTDTDIFAVGEAGEKEYSPECPSPAGCTRGVIVHYDGSGWSTMLSTFGTTLGYDTFNGVWGTSANDVFAVGALGTIFHYDGSTWSPMTTGTTEFLQGIWGSSSLDVFAVGSNGTILHYDGTSWTALSSGTTEILEGVWGSSGTDVFAVGSAGTILHYNGSAWKQMNSGTASSFSAVWGSSGTDVFAVGVGGVFHYGLKTETSMRVVKPKHKIENTTCRSRGAGGTFRRGAAGHERTSET